MKNNNIKRNEIKESNDLALHYMQTLAEVARESFLILDPNLNVLLANSIFYQDFHVTKEETEGKPLYQLGNGQWNIPKLKGLLEEILPKKKVIKNYEVSHVFETIGQKIILLNARQIDSVQLIILAMEDVTARKNLEIQLSEYTRGLEVKVAERTTELANRVKELETLNKTMIGRELKMVELKKEVESLGKLIKNGNGKNGNGNHKNG